MVWFLKRKPSLVGMVTLLPSKEIPSLMQATNSEHLLPEAMATRKILVRSTPCSLLLPLVCGTEVKKGSTPPPFVLKGRHSVYPYWFLLDNLED